MALGGAVVGGVMVASRKCSVATIITKIHKHINYLYVKGDNNGMAE